MIDRSEAKEKRAKMIASQLRTLKRKDDKRLAKTRERSKRISENRKLIPTDRIADLML